MTREELEEFIRRNPSPSLQEIYDLARLGVAAKEMALMAVFPPSHASRKRRALTSEKP